MKDRPIIKEAVAPKEKPAGAKVPIDYEVDYRRPLHERNESNTGPQKK